MRKIVDCIMFYNELDMLEFRLQHLYSSIDYMVIVEAPVTHQGDSKPLFFEENKNRFTLYLDKIIHVVVEDMPEGNSLDSCWKRENHQRECFIRGLTNLNLNENDIILSGCCDEIPNRDLIEQIKLHGINIFKDNSNLKYKKEGTSESKYDDNVSMFEMDMYWYNLETKHVFKWYFSRACTFKKLKEIGGFQKLSEYPIESFYSYGGWHFTYFGSPQFIATKIKSFAHQDLNVPTFIDEVSIKEKVLNKENLFNFPLEKMFHIKVEDNTFLPFNYEYLLDEKRFGS